MIEVLNWYSLGTDEVTEFLNSMVDDMSTKYKRNGRGISFYRYIQEGGRIAICRIDGEIKGISMIRTFSPLWDKGEIRVYQDLVYGTVPEAGRMLLDELIDFTKNNADAIICMVTDVSDNEKSLLKRGFKRLETQYILEV